MTAADTPAAGVQASAGRPLGDRGWLGVRRSDGAANRWTLTVQPRICGRTGYLHGGCSLAAATTAMEQATGRPLIWATAQYLSRAAVEEEVAYDVTIDSAGNRVSQASAVATVGDRVVARFLAAFGQRPGASDHRWGEPPVVPGPDDSGGYELTWEPDGSFHRTVELRVAAFDRERGTAAFWVRMPDGVHESSAGLAMLGDYVPAGFRLVLSETEKPASSLDNTVRVIGLEPSDWLLLDIRLGRVADGAAHGDLRAWARSGRLVGMASQTFLFNV
ncbi:MAG: thioesterase family protein [Acidimicrobiales bacterium]